MINTEIPTIYVLIGNIGSGKSTWAKKQLQVLKNTVIVCKDDFRKSFNGKYLFDPLQETIIHKLSLDAVLYYMSIRYSVICDETHIKRKHRTDLLRTIRKRILAFNTVYVYFPDHGKNVEWRMHDGRGYTTEQWQQVYDAKKLILQPPARDERYDSLIVINHEHDRTNHE